MGTLSVREIARHRFDATGDLSINADLYGYIHRDSGGRLFGLLDPATDVLPGLGTPAAPTTRSLRRQLETCSGDSVDLVIFMVGQEPDFSGSIALGDMTEIQYALQVARDLYADVDLGIRRVEWDHLSQEEGSDFVIVNGRSEARRLTHQANGREGAIDVFIVKFIQGFPAGWSPAPGPCEKRDSILGRGNGCVVELAQSRQWTGHLIAHEVGHYLGLKHEHDRTNLMCGGFVFDDCDPGYDSTGITAEQAQTMKHHCMIVH
jgi:hypothetical protein